MILKIWKICISQMNRPAVFLVFSDVLFFLSSSSFIKSNQGSSNVFLFKFKVKALLKKFFYHRFSALITSANFKKTNIKSTNLNALNTKFWRHMCHLSKFNLFLFLVKLMCRYAALSIWSRFFKKFKYFNVFWFIL